MHSSFRPNGANAAVPQVSCARKKSAFGAAYAETAPGNNKGGTKKRSDILPLLLQYFCCSALPHVPAKLPALKRRRPLLLKRLLLQTPRKAAVQKNRSSSMSGRKTLKPHCRSMKRSMSTRTTSIRSNTRLNLKRMVNAIFRYLQIYCSAGTTVGFSRIFAFVNKSKS